MGEKMYTNIIHHNYNVSMSESSACFSERQEVTIATTVIVEN